MTNWIVRKGYSTTPCQVGEEASKFTGVPIPVHATGLTIVPIPGSTDVTVFWLEATAS